MPEFIKRFKEWFSVKLQLDTKKHAPPLFNEREVWWCFVGENIGFEVNGKGQNFWRPVLILKKLDRFSFIGIPFTLTIRKGSWYKQICFNNKQNTAMLSQVRYFDYRRLHKIMTTLSVTDYNSIKEGVVELINKPPVLEETGGRGECQTIHTL